MNTSNNTAAIDRTRAMFLEELMLNSVIWNSAIGTGLLSSAPGNWGWELWDRMILNWSSMERTLHLQSQRKNEAV